MRKLLFHYRRKCNKYVPCATFIILLIMAFRVNSEVHAQSHIYPDPNKCDAFYYGPVTKKPPLNSSMPYDVMLAYIVLDSVCKVSSRELIESRVMLMSEDSLRMAYQYWYKVLDYDPLLLKKYIEAVEIDSTYASRPIYLFLALKSAYNQYEAFTVQENVVLWSQYIYHVRVENISMYTHELVKDTSGVIEYFCAKMQVLEKFKGECIPDTSYDSENPQKYVVASWDRYRPNDPSRIRDSSRYNLFGEQRMSVGGEYIVFLGTKNTSTAYGDGYYLQGGIIESEAGYWFMSITDGAVYDESEFFGLGKYIDLVEFKSHLREIKNRL